LSGGFEETVVVSDTPSGVDIGIGFQAIAQEAVLDGGQGFLNVSRVQ
jgi:hypothetical protein